MAQHLVGSSVRAWGRCSARTKGLADQWLSPADQRRLEEIEKIVAEPAEALSLNGPPVLPAE